MTGNQASPAQAALPAPEAAAARWHQMRNETAGYALLLLGGAAAAVAAMAMPAMASPVTGHAATSTGSISAILKAGDIVTGVRGTTDGDVILTGSHATGGGTNTLPFLYQGPLTSAAAGAEVTTLTPPFPGFDNGTATGTFYGPDTSTYNPDTIPAGQVRAVGSYRTNPG
jgi:hypothetical protein